MKSRIQLVCPVSGQRAKPIEYAEGGEGIFEPYEPEGAVDLPSWWGRIALDIMVPNTDLIAEIEERREIEIDAALAQIDTALNTPGIDPGQRAHLQMLVATGQARKDAEALVAERYPTPEPYSMLRLQYPVLGSEAVPAAIKGLRAAGFTIDTEALRDAGYPKSLLKLIEPEPEPETP